VLLELVEEVAASWFIVVFKMVCKVVAFSSLYRTGSPEAVAGVNIGSVALYEDMSGSRRIGAIRRVSLFGIPVFAGNSFTYRTLK